MGGFMALRYEKLTYQIRSCIFEVANQIGSGNDEETYHRGLIQSFRQNGVPFISKQARVLFHRGKLVRKFINDFLVFNKIILSLKCVPCRFLQSHYVQLFSELKLWKYDLGMLVNFGLPNLAIERYVFTERTPVFEENYKAIEKKVQPDEKEIIRLIRSTIKNVACLHGPGFGKLLWRKIVEIELEYQNIQYDKGFLSRSACTTKKSAAIDFGIFWSKTRFCSWSQHCKKASSRCMFRICKAISRRSISILAWS